MSTPRSAAAVAVESQLFDALAVLRVVVLLNAVGLNLYRRDNFEHPTAAAVCVGLMVAWTAVATWAYRDPRRRTAVLLVLDLALAVGLVLITPELKGNDFRATLPGFWIVAALLAWAAHFRWTGGLVAGVVLAAADLSRRQDLAQSDYGNAFLLVLAGAIVGYLCASLQGLATEREVAERAAAIAEERVRLGRAVHDGVLQVLALVQRRGRTLGGEAAELGDLAGEQERQLRRLIQAQHTIALTERADVLDLTAELADLETIPGVTVSGPGFPVELPGPVARELVAATRACLDNVKVHVGVDAAAWVLLQARPHEVEVSVRDEGPGIPPGRLDEAVAQGRLGVDGSIRGRIADLGGTAELTTGTGGTEWELVVPRTGSI